MARAPLGLPISPRNAHTLKEIARSLAPRPAECAAVSPDGRWIAAGTRTGVQIHDVESLRLHRAFDTERPVRAIGFGPDSAVVWIVEHADTACGLGETARAYRWQAAEPCPMETEITFPRPRSTTQVFASGAAGFVVFAGPITGIYDLEKQRFLDLPPGAYPATAAAVSPRRDRVAFAAWEEVMVVDLGSGRVTARLTLPRNQPAQKTEVRAVAFSADGRWIAAGARQRLVLWDGEAGSAPTVIETGMAVGGLAFSPDGALIAAEDSATPWGRSVVGLWEVASGRLLHRLDAGGRGLVDLLAFGPHGGSLFVRHYGDDVRLWDTRTGRLLTTLLQSTLPASPPPFVLPPNDLAVSHDGLWEAKVGVGRGVDQVTDSPLCNRVEVVHRGTGQVIRSFDTPAVDLANLSLSPDNKLLLAQCRSGALDLLDAATGDHLHRLCWREDRDSRSCWQAAPRFSPDGEWVAAALEGGRVGLYRVASAERVWVLEGQTRVRALAFHPEGSLLGTSSDDRRIRLWEVHTGRRLAVLEGHTEPAHALGFTADGALLGSSSHDGSTRAWGVRHRPAVASDLAGVELVVRPDPVATRPRIGPDFPVLPFVVLVLGALTSRPLDRPIEDLKPLRLRSDNLTAARAKLGSHPGDSAALDPTWASLAELVGRAGETEIVEILPASLLDLAEDFDDSPAPEGSGLARIVNHYNHLGMRPFAVLAVADDPGALLADRGIRGAFEVMRQVVEVAARAHAVVLLPEALVQAVWPEIRKAGWHEGEAAGFAAGVSSPIDAARRLVDSHARPGAGPDRSAEPLSVTLFVNRLAHEVLNIQWRRALAPKMDVAALAAGLRSGLAARVSGAGFQAHIRSVERRGTADPEAHLVVEWARPEQPLVAWAERWIRLRDW